MEILPEKGHSFCVGDYLTLSDLQAPAYLGSPEVATYWEISAGTTPTNFVPFTFPRQLSYADNNKWIRLHAIGCGEGGTNAIQLQVYDAPSVATPTVPAAICAGNSFNLIAPTIQNYGEQPIDQGWQIAPSQNGNYVPFDNNEVTYDYNGWWLRYFVQNDCGFGYSQPVQITVNDSPLVGDITPPAPIFSGEAFDLLTPTVEWRHENPGSGVWEIASPNNGNFQLLDNNNIPFYYDRYLLRYRAVNDCDTTYSNMVPVTVYPTDQDPIILVLTPGWNWIGYLLHNVLTIEEAFANLTPSDGDIIKGQNGVSYYQESTQEWIGSLRVLIPGRGYMYNNNSEETKSFYYPW